jgi:hypothetical protein
VPSLKEWASPREPWDLGLHVKEDFCKNCGETVHLSEMSAESRFLCRRFSARLHPILDMILIQTPGTPGTEFGPS